MGALSCHIMPRTANLQCASVNMLSKAGPAVRGLSFCNSQSFLTLLTWRGITRHGKTLHRAGPMRCRDSHRDGGRNDRNKRESSAERRAKIAAWNKERVGA